MNKDELKYSDLKLDIDGGRIRVIMDTYDFQLMYEEACWLHFLGYGIIPWYGIERGIEYRFVYVGDDLQNGLGT